MTGSKTTSLTRNAILKATENPPLDGDFVWDGQNEDDRPLTRDEMLAGVEVYRKKRGRPVGQATKVSTTVRFDREVLEAFRATGPGWQSRMNAALKEWLKEHTA
jgi:uncharacterized protein (DUF4415 family)